jgi:hypothetical protein
MKIAKRVGLRPARGLETGCKGTKKWANGKIIAMKILGCGNFIFCLRRSSQLCSRWVY